MTRALAIAALALAGCTPSAGPLPDTHRELWRGEIDGDQVIVAAYEGGDRAEDGTEIRHVSVHVDAPYVVDALPNLPSYVPVDKVEFTPCPVPHGIVFKANGEWFGAWRVKGGTIAMTLSLPAATAADTCPTVSFDPAEAARQAQDQRWCRLLDDAGFMIEGARCIVALDHTPAGATWNPELKTRYQTDQRHRNALADAVLDSLQDPANLGDPYPCIGHALAANELARRLADRCTAGTCDPAVLDAALTLIEQGHTEPLRSDVCSAGRELAASLKNDPTRADRVRTVILADCTPVVP